MTNQPLPRPGSLSTGLALIVCLLTGAIQAAEQPVESMLVTAHRIAVSEPEVGSAFSIIEREQLEERQSTFTADVLGNLPGVAISRTAHYGSQTQVRIRGAEANQVLVLIDGVEVNDPAGNDEFDFASLMSYDVGRVEVLRGPQSALWGSDATAGVINITTQRGTKPLEASTFLEGGSFGRWYGGGRVSLNSERAGANLHASYFDNDGDSAADAGNEDDGYENLTLSLNTRWEVTDNARVGLVSRYTDATTDIDGVDFSTGLPADANRSSEDQFLLLGATATVELLEDSWTQDFKITYFDSDRDQLNEGNKTASTSAEKVGFYYQSAFNLGDWGFLKRKRLIVGLEYEDEDFEQRGVASPFGNPNQDQNLDNTGFVAEFLTEPLDGLNLSASVRHDENSDFDNVDTYRLTAAYQLQRFDTQLHGSWGKSQKSPTFIERYGFFPEDGFIGNDSLQPEENRGWDAGFRQSLFGNRTRLDVTYFSERLENEIDGFVFDSDSGLFTAANLDGRSRRDGVEIDVLSQLSDNIRATFSYTYTDSRAPTETSGHTRELRRPRHTTSANFNNRMLDGRANINFNLSYTAKQKDRYFPGPSFEEQTVTLDSYVVFDAAVSFQLTRQVLVYGRANNIADEDVVDVVGYRGPQRAVYAGIRIDFDS